MCCDPRTKEDQIDPATDMYQCYTSHRIYHWQCLMDLECCTDAQRNVVIANDDWARPACSHLTLSPKKKRNNFQSKSL